MSVDANTPPPPKLLPKPDLQHRLLEQIPNTMPSLTPAPGMQQDNSRKFRKSTIERRNIRNKLANEVKVIPLIKVVPTIVRKTKTKSKIVKKKKSPKVLTKPIPKLEIEDSPEMEEQVSVTFEEVEPIRKRRKATVGRRKYCRTNKKKIAPENAPRTKRKYVKSLKYSKKTKALLYEITQSMKIATESENSKKLEPCEEEENIIVANQSESIKNSSLETLKEPVMSKKWPRIKHSYTTYYQVYNIGFAETTKGIVYKCFSKSCKFQTYDQGIFKNHLISFHDDVPSTTETFCAFCNEVFSSSSLLHELEHINEKHLEFASNTGNTTTEAIEIVVLPPLEEESSILKNEIKSTKTIDIHSIEDMQPLLVIEKLIEVNLELKPEVKQSIEVETKLLPMAEESIERDHETISREHETLLEEFEHILEKHEYMLDLAPEPENSLIQEQEKILEINEDVLEILEPMLTEHEPKTTTASPILTEVNLKQNNLKTSNKKVYLERRSDEDLSRKSKQKSNPSESKLNITKMMQDFSDISSDEDSIFNDSLELKGSMFDFNDISSDESIKSFKSVSSSTHRINKIFNNPDFCVQRILHDGKISTKRNLTYKESKIKHQKQTEKPKLTQTSQIPTQVTVTPPLPPLPPPQSVQTQIQVTVQTPVVMNKLNIKTLQPWIDKRPNFKYEVSCMKMLEKNSLFATYKCMGFTCSYFTSSEHMFYGHLKLHQQNHLCDYPDTYLFCSYCSLTFEKIKDLLNHIKEIHQHDKYQCSHCFYRSCEVQSCSVHMDIYHSKQESKTVLECEIENVPIDIDGLFEKLIENRLKYVAPLRCKGKCL